MTPTPRTTNPTFRLFSSKSLKVNSQSFNSKQSRRLARLILARKTSFSLSSTGQQQKSLSLHNVKVFQTNAKGIHDSIVSQSSYHSANPSRRTFTLKVGSFSRFFPSLSFKTPVFTPNGLISRSKNRSKLFFKSQYHSNRVRPTRALVSVHSNLSRPGKFLRLSSLSLPHSLTANLTDSYNSGLRRARLIRRVRIKSRRVTAYNTLSSTHYDVFSSEPARLPFSEQPVAGQLLRSVQGVSQSNLSLNGWPKSFFPQYLNDKYTDKENRISGVVLRALRRQAVSSRRSSFLVNAVRSLPHLSNQIAPSWLPKWSHLTQVYNSFSYLPRLDLYIRLKLAQRDEIKHFLRFRFNRQRLFVILEDKNRKRTHMFVTPGLFLRYFEKKKSLKKNRSMKFLMMRFLRKILLVLNLKSVGIITRGIPLHLDSLMTSLFRPLSHPFPDPLTGLVINESDSVNPERGDIHVNSTLFLSSKPFAPQKTRKRGRIKRKIKRRLVRTNSLID